MPRDAPRLYGLAYMAIFGSGGYFLLRLLRAGPVVKPAGEPHGVGTAARPLSAASE